GEVLGLPHWLPAAGQGALAIVARIDDDRTLRAVEPLDHPQTRAATTAERALLAQLEGGCQIPIGALGTLEEDQLTLHGLVASLDGSKVVRAQSSGPAQDAERIGVTLAQELVENGAGEVLEAVRSTARAPRPAAP